MKLWRKIVMASLAACFLATGVALVSAKAEDVAAPTADKTVQTEKVEKTVKSVERKKAKKGNSVKVKTKSIKKKKAEVSTEAVKA